MKSCPFCAEEIQDAAIVCKHCRRDLNAPATAKPAAAAPPTPPAQAVGKRQGFGLLALFIGFIMTIASSSTASFGILLMWVGIALAMKGGAIVRWGVGFVAAMLIGGFAMSMANTVPSTSGRPATSSPATSAAPSTPQLALLSSRDYESEYGGHHFVEGQVKNLSDRPLQNVTAVASWFDKDGNFVKTADALIDFNPILPGQTSPYKTITSSNPAMTSFTVEFKTLMGGSLSVEDQRKKDQRKK